jgi:hypothetical protein
LIFASKLLFSQTFVEAMQSHLLLVSDTVDTSLEASLPEIQRQFNQLHSEVKTGNVTVCEKLAGVCEQMTGFSEKIDQSLDSRPTRAELAGMISEMAVRMAGGSSSLLAGQSGATNVNKTRLTTTRIDKHNGDDWVLATVHTIQVRDLMSVHDIYSEFKGLGQFKGSPIAGGLEECERRWKSRWRRHFIAADKKRFSRMSMLTKAVDEQVAIEGHNLDGVLASFDAYFVDKKRSFCGLIELLQTKGLIRKKFFRRKRIVQGDSPEKGGW